MPTKKKGKKGGNKQRKPKKEKVKKSKARSKGDRQLIETHFKEDHLTPSMRRQMKIEREFQAPDGCWNQTKDQHWYGCDQLREDNKVIRKNFNDANRGVLFLNCPPDISEFPVYLKKYISTNPFRNNKFFDNGEFVTFKFGALK
jgi:hypothetical protein